MTQKKFDPFLKASFFQFTVRVEPVAKKRVRVFRTTTGIRGVNKSKEDEDVLRRLFSIAKGVPASPVDVPCLVGIRFYRSVRKSIRKKDRLLVENEIFRPFVKPDLDNYIKLVKDAGNGILWEDDNLIVGYLPGTGKYYTLDNPRIEFTILTLGQGTQELYIKILEEEIEKVKSLQRPIDEFFGGNNKP